MADNRTNIILTASDQTRAAFASAEKSLSGLKTLAGSLAGALGVGLSVSGLVSFVKSTIDAADAMNDMAIRAGTSVEALAAYELVAKQSGTDVEGLAKGLGKLTLFMGQNAEEAQALGITARDPVQAFAQLADALGKTTDPVQRNTLAAKVLGKSYADLMPLLIQGGSALREQAAAAGPYAARMAQMAEAADAFNDSLAKIQTESSMALLPLVKLLADTAEAANQAAEGLDGMDAALTGLGQLGTLGQTIGVLWANVAYVFDQVGTEIGGIAAQVAAIASGNFKEAGFIGDAMKADAKKARAELDALEKRILEFKTKAAAPANKKAKSGGAQEEDGLAGGILSPADARKLQDTLAKAFDTKPLDDFVASFKDKAESIKAEYAKLNADLSLGDAPNNPTGFDVTSGLVKAREALNRGDVIGAQAMAGRNKDMLKSLADQGAPSFETAYLSNQLRDFELEINKLQEKTAASTRDAFVNNLNAAKLEIEKMDPLKVPIAADAIANDIKAAIEIIRKDLAANPIAIPTVVQGQSQADISRAAAKLGGR